MSEESTQKLIDEQMAQLPEVNQKAIKESGWEKTLQVIGYKHGLLLDEIESLSAETLILMLGLSDTGIFTENISHHSGITEDLAKKITHDIFEEIFTPIYETIKKASSEKSEEHAKLFEDVQSGKTSEFQPKRSSVLDEIENPTKGTPSVSRMKLKDIFSKKPGGSKSTETKIEAPTPVKPKESTETKPSYSEKSPDPYLEPID